MPVKSPLLPDRHPQTELFLADIADAILKDDLASMEHPLFTLSKHPDLTPRRYEHNGNRLEITPSVKGMATVFDKDILIFAISQLIAAKKAGRPISKTLEVSPRSLLVFTNRETGGRAYKLLEDALARLQGTQIKTDIKTGGQVQTEIFSLIDTAQFVRDEKTGRIQQLQLRLSDWTYNAITADEVLTLAPDYFRLGKPLERRVYELARKHCGQQANWKVSIPLLFKKSGSTGQLYKFRHAIRKMAETDHLPDYSLRVDEDDHAHFVNRSEIERQNQVAIDTANIHLDPETYHEARTVAPGWDVYEIEREWRNWIAMPGIDLPRDPDAAFIGFAKSWAARQNSI